MEVMKLYYEASEHDALTAKLKLNQIYMITWSA